MIKRHVSFSASAVAACLLGGAAASQELPIDVVELAVAGAEARGAPDQRWAFTRAITLNGATLSARYDPSRPADDQWRLLDPEDEAALSEEQRRLLDGLRAEPVSDRLLMIEAPHENYGMRLYVGEGLELASESAHEKRYTFRPRDDVGLTFPPLPAAPRLEEEVSGELVITTSEPTLSGLRLLAAESFKPNPLARVDVLDISWEFGETEPGGPIAILRSESHIAGRAAFRSFEAESVVVNSDFERADVPQDLTAP